MGRAPRENRRRRTGPPDRGRCERRNARRHRGGRNRRRATRNPRRLSRNARAGPCPLPPPDRGSQLVSSSPLPGVAAYFHAAVGRPTFGKTADCADRADPCLAPVRVLGLDLITPGVAPSGGWIDRELGCDPSRFEFTHHGQDWFSGNLNPAAVSLLPLRFVRQIDLPAFMQLAFLAQAAGQPAAEGAGLEPGHADHGMVGEAKRSSEALRSGCPDPAAICPLEHLDSRLSPCSSVTSRQRSLSPRAAFRGRRCDLLSTAPP